VRSRTALDVNGNNMLNYSVSIAYNSSTGDIIMVASHDGFPSYTVSVNHSGVYDHQQAPGFSGVFELAGEGNVKAICVVPGKQ
jgi:hypothetical protein